MKKPLTYKYIIRSLAKDTVQSRIDHPNDFMREGMMLSQLIPIAKIYRMNFFKCFNDYQKIVEKLSPKTS